MILRRLETAGACEPAIDVSSRITPSTRARTNSRFACGVKWMSDAPSSSAFAIVRLMKTTAGVSWSRSRTVASSCVSSPSASNSSISITELSWIRAIDVSIVSEAATQTRTGMPRASRSSSENITFVGSATATSTNPSSRKRTGQGDVASREVLGQEHRGVDLDRREVELDVLELVLLGEHAGDLRLGRGSGLDEDLAEPFRGLGGLRGERRLELLRR